MTTNRTGLEQTLSDERLEDLAKGQYFFARGAYEEAQAMARELLAYRKASKEVRAFIIWPDGEPERGFIVDHNEDPAHKQGEVDCDGKHWVSQPLYAAPPLQAVTDGWVKCSERMPTIGDRDIWIWNGEYAHSGCVWDGNAFVDWNEEYEELKGVTHWMPMELPASPQR